MTAEEILIEFATRGIALVPEGTSIRFVASRGEMPEQLASALSREKSLILAVNATLRSRKHDAAWRTLAEWAHNDAVKTFTPAVLAAAKEVKLPVPADEWPAVAARRFQMALKVRALLAVFADPPVSLHDEPPVMIAPEGEKQAAGAA